MKTITRKVPLTNVDVMLYHEEEKTVEPQTLTFNGKLTEKQLRKEFMKEDLKVVDVINIVHTEIKMSMPLETFIANAIVVTE